MHRETTTPKCRTQRSTVQRAAGLGMVAALAVSSIAACAPGQEPGTPVETTDPEPSNTQTVEEPSPSDSDTITIPSTPDTPKEEEPPVEAEPEFDIKNVKIGDMVPADKVKEVELEGHRVYVSPSHGGKGEVFEEGTVPKAVYDDVNEYRSIEGFSSVNVESSTRQIIANGIEFVGAYAVSNMGWGVVAYTSKGEIVDLAPNGLLKSKDKAFSIATSYGKKVGIPVINPE